MSKLLVLLSLFVVLLGACFGGSKTRAVIKDQMMRSKEAYQDCLKENPNNPEACKNLRMAFEADVQALEATWPLKGTPAGISTP